MHLSYESAEMQEAPQSLRCCGIMSLPSEILIYIMERLCAETNRFHSRRETNQLIKQLSSVSRTFRTGVLNTVAFWTLIDDEYCLRDGFDVRLARSKDAPLHLKIFLMNDNTWEKVLSATLPYKDRLKRLTIFFREDAQAAARVFSPIELPCLESLSLLYTYGYDCDMFFTQWRFPHLKALTLEDTIPPPGLFSDLTAFDLITWHIIAELSDAFLAKLMSFLGQARSLQKLALKLTCMTEPSSRQLPIVELPNVTTFTVYRYAPDLGFIGVQLSIGTLGRIMQALRIPNASDFRLVVQLSREEDIADCVASFAPMPEVLRLVTFLTLSTNFRGDEGALTALLALLPNVQHLGLDVPFLDSELLESSPKLRLDRLRSLALPGMIVDICRRRRELLYQFTSYPEKVDLVHVDIEDEFLYSSDYLDYD